MSNLIKSSFYTTVDDIRVIDIQSIKVLENPAEHPAGGADAEGEGSPPPDPQQQLRAQLLHEAELAAEQRVREAMEEAETIKAEALAQIEQWWTERRRLDEETEQAAKEAGKELGYKDGVVQAESAVQEKYAELIGNAEKILQQAFDQKQQIIQEAEPFLVELSCSIAGKIIGRQLTIEPEWVIGFVQNALSRKRERGVITLCVSPKMFAYICDSREELQSVLDSQAELQIIPDSSIHDQGCVVRSAFGSIDARVETQLTEIKHALIQLTKSDEDQLEEN